MNNCWFESKDYPLANADWPGTFPSEHVSESGLRFVLDIDQGDERCLATREFLFDNVVCFMPKGHDTPHMPMSRDLVENVGPMIVRSIRRGEVSPDGE